jgi:DNA-directed RNA polymerase specialized sigma24 family protein
VRALPVPCRAERGSDARTPCTDGRDEDRPGSSRDPFDDVNVREDVRQMLRSISPRQRMAIVLTDILGYSPEQAAHIMRIQPTTARVLASQGRATLKEN